MRVQFTLVDFALIPHAALDPLVATIAREPRTVASLLDGMPDGLAGRPDVDTADIQAREVTPVSMMPMGLLDALTDREVIDLVGYLKAVSPLTAR